MLNFNNILIGSENPKELANFYSKIFGEPVWSDNNYTGWVVGSGFIAVGGHDKVKGKNANPERILVNFETKDVEGEFKRIKGLGAEVVQEPYHPGEMEDGRIATFADPDGNLFQLMSPWEADK